ncbi:MAG: hypothetical protein ACE5HO_11810 [bacterium]
MASVIGLELPLGKGFFSYIQLHGHVQLIGWAGLFIIGISLHFIPRLAGVPVADPAALHRILRLVVSGLILRFVSQAFLPYLTGSAWFLPIGSVVVFSGVLEWVGIFLYLKTLLQTMQSVPDLDKRPALKSVKPFFAMMVSGWFLYATINVLLLLKMLLRKEAVLNLPWNEFGVQAFIGLVLLPVAFAFSVRMFPLYLRLPIIDWSVGRVAVVYLIALALQLISTLPPVSKLQPRFAFWILQVGSVVKGLVILWFVWKLDLLTRRREPWTVHRILQPQEDRRPTREGLPDYGEFGRFERLVYAAYAWLVFGALIEVLLGVTALIGWTLPISSDAVRHIYLLGFITHLILGMAVRMIPGFIKKKEVAVPGLVNASFWLATVAVFSRVASLVTPVALLQRIPEGSVVLQTAFAFSGVFGIAAVACLATNLVKTAKL